jgi:hypothetical protein
VFFLLSHAATIIGAFLIAYFTHGFWVKEASYREQPRVKHLCFARVISIFAGHAPASSL